MSVIHSFSYLAAQIIEDLRSEIIFLKSQLHVPIQLDLLPALEVSSPHENESMSEIL